MSNSLLMYAFVSLVTSLTPGAGVLYTVSNAFRFGKSNAWRSPVGNALGVAFMSAVSATGLGAVIAANALAFTAMQAGGALVLVWLGWKNWKAPAVDLARIGQAGSLSAASRQLPVRRVIPSAAVLQVSNPMLIVFLLSLMPPFISRSAPYGPQAALLSAIFVLICLMVHLVYSYTACFAGRYLRGPRFSWWLNRISAVLFWLCAVGVLWHLARP